MGKKDYFLKVKILGDKVVLQFNYKSEFLVDGVEEYLCIEFGTLNKLMAAIKNVVIKREGRQEFSSGLDHIIVHYGGPDYQPIVTVLNKRLDGVMSITIPESECEILNNIEGY
ncbi:MAG: hypothetical protein VX447_13030 [Pseudomonadota bacterium]|uniref:hypothetical protein n=1 Tax=Gallaecimonas pentaromativorans TaxID=584787 RepID=UPI00067F1315|nr:hypothetical protein [Gallaecimonas pentaromativorans]MED5525660.1 hypothetical protein [Pseudomonadota bacterium]